MAPTSPPVALLLPGQGSQYPRMAAGLYGSDPVFTAALDEVLGHLGEFGTQVRADWLADEPAIPLDHVLRSQVLLFAVDYALGRLVLSWGVRPAALLGHSMGEVAAATLAGVLDLPDAVRLMHERVHTLAEAPPGGMLAVAASVAEIEPHLPGDVVVGAVNAPRQTILAGLDRPLRDVAATLTAAGLIVRRVPAMTAFHSPVLAELAATAEPGFAATALRPPSVRLYSGYRGERMSDETAVDPAYWAAQPAEPVLFWPALQALIDDFGDEPLVLCETGPGTMLSTVAMRHPAISSGRATVVTMMRPPRGGEAGERASVEAARLALRVHARA